MNQPDREMAAWSPEDPPRRPSFGRDLFGFGLLMAVLLVLYGVFA